MFMEAIYLAWYHSVKLINKILNWRLVIKDGCNLKLRKTEGIFKDEVPLVCLLISWNSLMSVLHNSCAHSPLYSTWLHKKVCLVYIRPASAVCLLLFVQSCMWLQAWRHCRPEGGSCWRKFLFYMIWTIDFHASESLALRQAWCAGL